MSALEILKSASHFADKALIGCFNFSIKDGELFARMHLSGYGKAGLSCR